MYKEICDYLKEMSKYDTFVVDINKLREIDDGIDYELEVRSGNERYERLYNKFQKSNSGKVRLDINDLDYIAYIYEDRPEIDEIVKILYKNVK